MALVDYGSSDESDNEQQRPAAPGKTKQKPSSSKPTFHKLVDSSNPNKIKVNLSMPTVKDSLETTEDEPPAKRPKIGGGGFKDFNSILPQPKQPAGPKNMNRGGLGKGVSLKTGVTPGFTREPMQHDEHMPEHADAPETGSNNGVHDRALRPEETGVLGATSAMADGSTKKSTMFKPLSVARKPQKKKTPLAQNGQNGSAKSSKSIETTTNPVPEISLFPSNPTQSDHMEPDPDIRKHGDYEPMLYQPSTDDAISLPSADPSGSLSLKRDPDAALASQDQDESLDAIASSLNLTPSQKRQLLGRNATKSSAQAIKVTNFNTDAEYAANEVLRQSGETVQHQALRPIAGGGKHSLKQLVSSAVGQKDALEEKFAEGSRNRKEGAGRYGW